MSSDYDLKAVADAIAVRFGPTVISPPSGETAITQATAALPDVISDDQVLLVFPPELDFSYGPSIRKTVAEFPVRFFIYKVRDTTRNTALLYAWLSAFYDALDGNVHLGLSTYVYRAVVDNIKVGEISYGGERFYGLDFTVRVGMGEALSAVA